MRFKIIAIYFLSFSVLTLSSCSEISNTNAKELRSSNWQQSSDDHLQLSLSFKNDDAVLKVYDIEKKSEYKITGTTIVTDENITINDNTTLSNYSFNYSIYGDKVELNYKGKNLELKKSNSKK